MLVRFRQADDRLQVRLVATRRVAGRVRHEHVANLGAITLPPSVADRLSFWRGLHERLAKLSHRVDTRDARKDPHRDPCPRSDSRGIRAKGDQRGRPQPDARECARRACGLGIQRSDRHRRTPRTQTPRTRLIVNQEPELLDGTVLAARRPPGGPESDHPRDWRAPARRNCSASSRRPQRPSRAVARDAESRRKDTPSRPRDDTSSKKQFHRCLIQMMGRTCSKDYSQVYANQSRRKSMFISRKARSPARAFGLLNSVLDG